MSDQQRFRIRRADGAWYAGHGAERAPTWTTEESEAYGIERREVAQGVLAWLRYLGFTVEVIEAG